jgi:RNA polymerase sigma factor (sigma-70 family)
MQAARIRLMSPDRELRDPPASARPGQFTTTHWTVVLDASGAGTAQATAALEQLCQVYWYPLYAYARRRGSSSQDAEDLVQGFFARLIEKQFLKGIERDGGRFRSFLLTSFNHFTGDERDRVSRLKRGGGQEVISLDAESAEERYRLEPADLQDPEKIFERRWALTVLEQVLARLKSELDSEGRSALFERLQHVVVGERGLPLAEIGAELGLSEGAVAVTVHRLRRRYRRLLQEEITRTVGNPAQVATELAHLLAVLRG